MRRRRTTARAARWWPSLLVVAIAGGACHRRAPPLRPLPARTIEVRIQPGDRGRPIVLVTGHLFAAPPAFDLQAPPCHGWTHFDTDPASLVPLDAGEVRIRGLGPVFALERQSIGYVSPPQDVFAAIAPAVGAPVTASASGGKDLPAFTLTASTPAPPEDVEVPDRVAPGTPLRLRFRPSAGAIEAMLAERARGHGVLFAWCDAPADDGSLTIPAAVTSHLVPGGGDGLLVTVARERDARTLVAGKPIALAIFDAGSSTRVAVP